MPDYRLTSTLCFPPGRRNPGGRKAAMSDPFKADDDAARDEVKEIRKIQVPMKDLKLVRIEAGDKDVRINLRKSNRRQR
jgi:hypothetical protein